eukprot:5629295-Pyramimonas_sp.AAC.1
MALATTWATPPSEVRHRHVDPLLHVVDPRDDLLDDVIRSWAQRIFCRPSFVKRRLQGFLAGLAGSDVEPLVRVQYFFWCVNVCFWRWRLQDVPAVSSLDHLALRGGDHDGAVLLVGAVRE